MASKMTSPSESGRQNGRNEESETCSLSDTEEMEVDCDSGVMSSVDPHPRDSAQASPLPKDTGVASTEKEGKPSDQKDSSTSQPNINTDGFDKNTKTVPDCNEAGHTKCSLSLALVGSTAAVKTGFGSLLPDFCGFSGLTQFTPKECKIAGRDVTVINMIGLHENNYCQESMDSYMGQTLAEDEIHAFLYMLPLHRLTDEDKMGVEWLQKVFGTSSLQFLITVFTYENEDCDSIIDDLKGNTVLEQLVQRSGGRYITSNNTLNNKNEMKMLLEKIDLMVSENKTNYTAASYSEQLKMRQTMLTSVDKEIQHERGSDTGGPAENDDSTEDSTEGGDSEKKEEKLKDQKEKNTSQPSYRTETVPGSGSSKTDHAAEDADQKETAETEKTEDQSKKKEEPRRKNNEEKLKELFRRLNLTDRNGKLSTSDVLKIDAHSHQPQGPKVEGEIARIYLNKLLMTDYKARYIPIKDENIDSGPTNVKCRDNKDKDALLATFLSREDMEMEVAKQQSQIHPMDIQMAVFHSADPFLKQYLLTKLSMCQYALPLLVPNPLTSKIEFPLWAFRQVWKSWKSTDTSGKMIIHKELMYGVETPMVSVFRLGAVSTSKSQLINSLINERHNTFFHRHCPGSTRARLLMDGVVEVAWYCPSGKDTDHFPECVAICNIHGDGDACKMQQTILSQMASVNVAFVPNLGDNDVSEAIVKELFTSPTPFICLFTEEDFLLKEVCKGKFKIGIRDRNQSDIVQELKKAINYSLSLRNFMLENLAQKPGIIVDEDSDDCRMAKEHALKIKNLLEGNQLSEAKKTFLPCQGKLWHDWCQKEKSLFRLHGNLEIQKILIKDEMRVIRSKQQKAGSSALMKLFLRSMDTLPSHSRIYFLKWTSILMDSSTSDKLVTLHHEYDEKWRNVLDLKKKDDKSKQLEKEQTELEKISDQLNAATFGLEHILREMGQIYEAEVSMTGGGGRYSKLPALAAQLMISGHPIELMDGDAAHVPMLWISAVLDEVVKETGNKRIFVLSVLGIQSTGKSTMLNAMFGLQFAVSAGRCTRGAFMQLVRVSKEISRNFDYILVVDTEGLRALELAGKATLHHDNELATFVIGLGHMTLINIFGENPSEMQDIIQIVVQALLRMKKVKLSPSCMFVHQNVGDITAGEKNMEGKRRLQDKLDEMTHLAAKEEDCDAKCFSEVISFDIQQDVKYFAQLWEGSPPMAPPNPCYSENVQDLRETILRKALLSQVMTFSEFKTRVSDLCNALLNENFVFSFKNTLEIAIYRKLETEYVKWTWSLREAMLHIENKLHNRIENDILDTIEERFLLTEMKPTYGEVEKVMSDYFDEHRDKQMLVQWRGRFEHKIRDLHHELVKETRKKLNDLIQQKKARKKLDEKKVHYQNTLFMRSKELALNLKQLNKSEKALKEEFNRMWEGWLPELTSDLPRVEDCDISKDILAVLSENYEESLLNVQRHEGDYKDIIFKGEYSKYVIPRQSQSQESEKQANQKKEHGTMVNLWRSVMKKIGFVEDHFKTNLLTDEDQESIKSLVQKIHSDTEKIITNYLRQAMGYNKTYIQAIAASVREAVHDYEKKVMKGQFHFKKSFKVDLLLFLCDIANKEFSELHRKFQKANDGFIYLENQRGQFYNVFENFCQGAQSSAVLASFICSKLELSITQAVYDQIAIDLASEMQCNLPALRGNRLELERHILLSLAEEEKFEMFIKYIHNPKQHFKSFITKQVKEYMATVSPKLLSNIQGNLKHKIKRGITAASSATEKVKKVRGDANMWLSYFSDELKDDLEFAEKSCADASEITEFDFLEEVVCKGLQKIELKLSESFSKLSFLKAEQFRRRPDEILSKHFCNCCWVQCPFCKAICTNTLEEHTGTDHSVPFHRANGLSGMSFRGTTNLCASFCTTDVASNGSFYPSHDSDELCEFKQYRKAGPRFAEWSISPDPAGLSSELSYWKWFMCRFQGDLEKYYNKTFQGPGKMPEQWSRYTKEDAKKSLQVYMLTDIST